MKRILIAILTALTLLAGWTPSQSTKALMQ